VKGVKAGIEKIFLLLFLPDITCGSCAINPSISRTFNTGATYLHYYS